MIRPLKIMTWLWKQSPDPHGYNAEKVNVWAAMLRRNITIPYTLACVTDTPDGIDSSVEIIPLPTDFDAVKCGSWSEKSGAPQCYRRLTMFAPDAALRFGADKWISMDMDVLVCGNIDRILTVKEPIKFYKGTSGARPYNGSMMHITAGHYPHVYERFSQAGAIAARSKFIGSDQAWISYVLGWTEPTWSETDGVYFYTKGFASRHCRTGEMRAPENMRILFFPGAPKPWDMLYYKQVRNHWRIDKPFAAPKKKPSRPPVPMVTRTGKPVARPRSGKSVKSGRYAKPVAMPAARKQQPRMKPPVNLVISTEPPLWSFDGPKGWGQQFQAAARRIGRACQLFVDATKPPDGSRAWVRLDQQGEWRQRTKATVTALHARGIKTLATTQDARWYDDKIAQHEPLKKWLPETRIIHSLDDALRIAPELTYPIVSKAAEGASSANVRKLESPEHARKEAALAFGKGILLTHDRLQKGYVYWQDMVPECGVDYRIIIAGRLVYGIIRDVRPGDFRASGSGKFRPIDMKTEREVMAAKVSLQAAQELGIHWVAFDVVFNGAKHYILEMSSSWLAGAYGLCPLFDRNLRPTKGDFMEEAVRLLCQA